MLVFIYEDLKMIITNVLLHMKTEIALLGVNFMLIMSWSIFRIPIIPSSS